MLFEMTFSDDYIPAERLITLEEDVMALLTACRKTNSRRVIDGKF
jgi:hypothetical protein